MQPCSAFSVAEFMRGRDLPEIAEPSLEESLELQVGESTLSAAVRQVRLSPLITHNS